MKTIKLIQMIAIIGVATTLFSYSALAKDKDNNPPGKAGGPGTNWENPPGAEGGAGASPDRKHHNKKNFKEWLEKHPKLKQKMDANGDGKIDKEERKAARELKKQKKAEWLNKHPELKAKMDANGDGIVDKTEKHAWKKEHHRRDHDNNPPGRAGGPGTNWENPPGAEGGKGASPDKKHYGWHKDRDNNPPGLAGGKGTNWENPKGPKGGPGASPDRKRA